MDRAFRDWVCPDNIPISSHEKAGLKKQLQSYTIYGPMLLLSSRTFENETWRRLNQEDHHGSLNLLYTLIAKHLKITHVAINSPIPLHAADDEDENLIRAPTDFLPVFGDFGPSRCNSSPTGEDFDKAYWVTAKQNGISQTWAPRWTMFSRGNITEKSRILELQSVSDTVQQGRESGLGCTAVDLYAGIGYFVFSYLKAGVSKVLGWDINPWSIEGLKRGTTANKWQSAVYREGCNLKEMANEESRLLIFSESNESAAQRVEAIRDHIPPVRHVNCGLLPSSKDSWRTAFSVLDTTLGGWIHVHENFAQDEMEAKAEEVRSAFQKFLVEASVGDDNKVMLESINRVKTYAPGVWHCVIDIYIPPQPASQGQ